MTKNTKLYRGALACGFALAAFCGGEALAAEAGALNWSPGNPGTYFGAMPPMPGLFLVNHSGVLNTAQNNGANGAKDPVSDFNQSGFVNVTRLLAFWPGDVGGIRMGSQLIVPIANVSTNFTNPALPPTLSGVASGVGNVQFSQMFDYAFAKVHHIGFSLNYASRIGSYNSSQSNNAASGYATWAPQFIYNYLDPAGLDLGVMASIFLNERNYSTNYRTGNMIGLDVKAMYRVAPNWKIGGYGGYLAQIEDDTNAAGAAVANSRYSALRLGPQVTWDFGRGIELSASYQITVSATNAPMTNIAWLTLHAPLYASAPPAPPVTAKY